MNHSDHAKIGEIYGVMAEFDNPTAIVAATKKAYAAGYRKMDAYSPYPVEELQEALNFHRNAVAPIVLTGGLLGMIGGFSLLYWTSVINYPINVGGRPLNSWPMFIPITFETTVLIASLSAVLGMILLNGLPRPYHPVFNIDRFELASRDHFFLCIEAIDPKFDSVGTKEFLAGLGPNEVNDVPA